MSKTPWTPGKWDWWTSCSWRRLRSNLGRETLNVLMPCVHSDGQPDITVSEADRRLIQAAPEMAEVLEKAERHIVALYRAMSPAGNLGEENAFADNDQVIREIRALLARIRGDAP